MSFDYLNDIFGKTRNRRTRFSDLESEAIGLMTFFIRGVISDKEFATSFNALAAKFKELIKVDGQVSIDQDTPLWLNSFLGFHFVNWFRYQQVKWYFEEHPEELTEEREEQFAKIQSRGYDISFKDTCMKLLEELK